jgi:hypothetical protein
MSGAFHQFVDLKYTIQARKTTASNRQQNTELKHTGNFCKQRLTLGVYSISIVTHLLEPLLVTIPGRIQKSASLNRVPLISKVLFGVKNSRSFTRRLSIGLSH